MTAALPRPGQPCSNRGAPTGSFRKRKTRRGKEAPCCWLKDRFGLSWQVIPDVLPQMLMDGNSEKAGYVMKSMLQMKKIDIGALQRAAHAA
jgi:predicted 3-demethylubiquinone-9 3-methyltransferase (glyoxalase superfamily)